MPRKRMFRHHTDASISVEFALIAVLFLVPLLIGTSDYITILVTQAQLNTGLQALYYYAINNTSSATNTTYLNDIITNMNSGSNVQLSMPATLDSGSANPSYSYYCFTTNSTSPTFTGPYTASTSCTTGTTTQTFVNYKLTATAHLPLPLPGIGSSFTLSASGLVQTGYTAN